MFETILTPDVAKQARAAVGLSQSKVAQATGISRTTLALFEVKKYLLDDDALTKLKQFYQEAGVDIPDSSPVKQSVSASGYRLMDGYAVPTGLPEEEAETILDEIHANDAEIKASSCQKDSV